MFVIQAKGFLPYGSRAVLRGSEHRRRISFFIEIQEFSPEPGVDLNKGRRHCVLGACTPALRQGSLKIKATKEEMARLSFIC